MSTFAKLRRPADLEPQDFSIPHRAPVADFSAIEPLIALCSSGRLYEVEQWIGSGQPIQCAPPDDRKLQRRHTPLQAAVANGFHSLAALLLANGYDPNGDYYECITPAVHRRDRGMIELLLQFGADPAVADFTAVLETYNRPLMDLFIEAGADPCARNAVARALRHKARPLLGFVKSYRTRFPGLQRQIDIALLAFVQNKDEKGCLLMLWLGADPYSVVPASAYPEDFEAVGSESAFESALWAGNEEILRSFVKAPIPAERVRDLFRSVAFRCRPEFVRRLLDAGANPNDVEEGEHVLRPFIGALTWRYSSSDPKEKQRGLEALEMVLAAGAKWEPGPRELARLRRQLLDGESRTVVRVVELLAKYRAFSDAQLHELTRTESMKKLLNGFTKPRTDPFALYRVPPAPMHPQPPAQGRFKPHWA
jgi:hypothetical protein